MAISQNSSLITDRGSGKMAGYAVSSTGSRISPVLSFPWLESSELVDDTAVNERETEGSTKFTTDGTRTVTFKAVSMQTDKDSLELLVKTYRDNYFVLCKEINEEELNCDTNYYVFPKAKPVKSMTHSAPGGTIEYNWNIENPGSSYSSIALTQFGTSTGLTKDLTGTYTPSAGEYWSITTIA